MTKISLSDVTYIAQDEPKIGIWGYGVVVSRLLCMQKVVGSIPAGSMFLLREYVVGNRAKKIRELSVYVKTYKKLLSRLTH